MTHDPNNEARWRRLEQAYRQGPINAYYAPEIEISEGRATITIETDPKMFHAAGAVHGSVYFKMLDDAAFFAANSMVDDHFVLTVSFTIQMMRPVTRGRLISHGTLTHATGRLFFAEARLVDDSGDEIARGSGTFTRTKLLVPGVAPGRQPTYPVRREDPMARSPGRPAIGEVLRGRSFVHPAFDYLLIGGGLSLIFTAVMVARSGDSPVIGLAALPYFLLLSNAAHFAASTVRLYAKPGAREQLPYLTMVFPLLSIVVLTACMFAADLLGPHLQSLYLTWSPYHYAAQAYGLAVMYSYRSGCLLGTTDKRLLFWVAMLPFLYNFTTGPDVGLDWLVPASIAAGDGFVSARATLGSILFGAAAISPVLLFVKVWRARSGPMPLLSIMTVVSNGVWFLVLGPLDAFVFATIFHGIQYLAIVIIFHVRDQLARPDNQHGRAYHVVWFYGASLLLGYGLFNCLPLGYVFAGFGRTEAILLVIAAINIHHFIVDAFIWRLGRKDGNRKIVESGTAASATAASATAASATAPSPAV